jgi:UDP-glucose 4-epimerase
MGTVLLTGGSGYVGSHIALNLLKKDFSVVIFDSFVNSSRGVFNKFSNVLDEEFLKKNLKIYKGDLRERNSLRNLFEDFYFNGKKIDSVIHCAGLKSVKDSRLNPLDYWDVNITGTINLIKIMNKFSCKKIIFSSSATVYDCKQSGLLNEKSKLKPINPYGNTKYIIEKFLEDIYLSSKDAWRIVNLRYFNPIGADPDGLIGESPSSEKNNIYPLILDVASRKLDKFTIFGNDWDTKDGTCVRDYIHIDDLAESHIRALKYISDSRPNFLNLNIGTGKGTSVLELINTFENINSVKVPYVFGQRREGDFGCVIADNSLAKTLLNWSPQKNLEDMCRDGWDWFKNSRI